MDFLEVISSFFQSSTDFRNLVTLFPKVELNKPDLKVRRNGKHKYLMFKDEILRRTTFKNGNKIEELRFRNGELNGLSEGFYEEGSKRFENFYTNGKLGHTVYWYENGVIRLEEDHDSNGKIHGLSTTSNWNGTLKMTVNYLHGRLHGNVTHYDQNGNFESQVLFINGKAVNETR